MNPLALFAGPMGLVYKWLVFAALLAAFGLWSYTKGVNRESDRRDAAELAAVQQERESHARMVAYGVMKAKEAQAAEVKADQHHQNWKEARNEIRRNKIPLAVADCSAADPVPPAAGSGLANPGAGPRLRLTWDFVGLYDSVHTDSSGQPIFGDTARTEKGSSGPGAPSPYTADDIIDNHGENAARWNACRRQLRALITTINGLERQWNQK